MATSIVRMKMRLSKGSQVEVQRWDGQSSYSWRCADVVSGNGRYYLVRIHGATASPAAVLERVPRKFIRPQPAPIGLRALYSWSPGDEVEALVDHAWWPAVVTAVGYGKVVVYLLGKMRKVRVRACELRLRRQWVDNQWTLVDKEPREAIISSGFSAAAESCNVAGRQSRIIKEDEEEEQRGGVVLRDSGCCSSVGSCS
ncbi:uncharacterized protein LOC122035795 [Zingiber officinale]|uniref:Agenet domain-containing protein n=1 Tax=Zingiber officinale TaxID=94328 RepID=A0A8J5M1Q8_ZINOF|nr:uncharacterized protein LOC122035795 [Zingiber officinale]KAG6531806.1 hypothetical protein ZIOFF_005632 [Zingiber officinale]